MSEKPRLPWRAAAVSAAVAFLFGGCAIYEVDQPVVGVADAPSEPLAAPGLYCVVTIEADGALIDYDECEPIVWSETGRFYHPALAEEEGQDPQDVRLQIGADEGWAFFQWRDAGDDEPDAGWSVLSGVVAGDVVAAVEAGLDADIDRARAAAADVEAQGPSQYGAVELRAPTADAARRFIATAAASRLARVFAELDARQTPEPDAIGDVAQFWIRMDEPAPREGRVDVSARLEPALQALRDLAASSDSGASP